MIPPLSGTLLIAANGALYGMWRGALISWFGVLAGALASYGLGRWLGEGALRRWGAGRHDAWLTIMRTHGGFVAVFAARLMPVILMNFIGYAAGVGRMSPGLYLAACAIEQTPAVIACTLLGDDLLAARLVTWRLAAIGLPGVGLAILNCWLLHRLR